MLKACDLFMLVIFCLFPQVNNIQFSIHLSDTTRFLLLDSTETTQFFSENVGCHLIDLFLSKFLFSYNTKNNLN